MLTKFRLVKPLFLVFATLLLSVVANAQINLSLKNVKVSDAITARRGPQQSDQRRCYRSIDL